MKFRLFALAAACLLWGTASAQDVGFATVAIISETMGINDGRICTGEFSRGDMGCAANAPYVSRTSGWMGVGSNNLSAPLQSHRSFTISDLQTSSSLPSQMVLSSNVINGPDGGRLYIGQAFTAGLGTLGFIQSSDFYGDVDHFRSLSLSPRGGGVLIGGSNFPSTTLHVSGTIRIGNGGEGCSVERAGAMRWNGSQFQVCYGSGGWALLSSAATSGTTGPANDRIISGTTSVMASQDQSICLPLPEHFVGTTPV